MTGARLTVSAGTGPLRAALEGVGAAVRSPGEILRAIGVGMAENVRTRMERGVGPDGRAWTPLKPAYAATKRGPGILRESLMLQRSITAQVAGHELKVGTNRIYGAVQQFGAVIRPKRAKALVFKLGDRLVKARKVTIPARPYLGLGAEDIETIEDVTWALVRRKLGA